MRTTQHLLDLLRRIDGRGYPAYKDLRGSWDGGSFLLLMDHVQGDPFAAPSHVRVRLDRDRAAFPPWATANAVRTVALCDFLTRAFTAEIKRLGTTRRGSGKSGLIEMETPRQEVLPRSSVVLTAEHLEARFLVGLPAAGRRVLGRQAAELLLEDVPALAERALRFSALDEGALRRHLACIEDQQALRGQLRERGLVAFVADGAHLPRVSGVDPRPMAGPTVPFQAPDALAVTLQAPNAGPLRGLGIPEGVTLIVGGGYHGKSTLLAALELGVWDHPPGDGREGVVSRSDTVKIRAEDGRRVEGVDIRPFIDNLPLGRDTAAFRSEDASGSTSQAAAIIEALEVGAGVLLMDEDTSATNFMIRDHRMQALVAKAQEPITPFVDRVRQLHHDHGVSTALVMGGSGDYFDVADTVIRMEAYRPHDATLQARAIAGRFHDLRQPEGGSHFGENRPRFPATDSLDPSRGHRDVRIDIRGTRSLRFGEWEVDLAALEQLVEPAQTRFIGEALLWIRQHGPRGASVTALLDSLDAHLAREGLDLLARDGGGLAQARRFEVAAALNRLRSLRVAAGQTPPDTSG